MKLTLKLLLVLFLINIFSVNAQQLPQFTQYMYNTISVNPAYAGSREALSIVGVHRNQWSGFDRAPKTNTLSIHTPLRDDRIGLGLSFINDALGYENFNSLYGDFSYTIQTGALTKLAFGIKGGFTHYNLDNQIFEDDPGLINDPLLANSARSQWRPNMGVGVYWHTNRWYLGLSAPRVFSNDYSGGEEEFVNLERVSYYFTGGYVFDLSTEVKLKPAFMLKGTNGAPLSVDATANFLFYDKLWLGVAYRFGDAFSAIADFQITNQFRVGYAYGAPVSDIKRYTHGTHEILLIYELRFDNPKLKSPRYF